MIVKKTITYLIFVVCFMGLAQKTTAQISFNPSLMLESRPYAPVSGTVLSENPNVVLGLEIAVDSAGTSLTYLKSFSWDTLGAYNGLFLVQKFTLCGQKFKKKIIHFADFTWQKRGLTVFALEALGGKKGKIEWSLQANYFTFQNRSSRWVLNPTMRYQQFSVSSWVYNEFDEWTVTMGAKWKSPKLSISKNLNMQVQAVYNDSWTKRFNPDTDGFGQENTISLGVVFTPKR